MLSLLPSDRGRRCHCLFEGPGVADATWYGAGRKNVAGRSARHSRKALDAARSAINADSQPRYASNTWENNSNKRPCRMLSLLPSDRGRCCRCLFEGPGVAYATWYGAGRKTVADAAASDSGHADQACQTEQAVCLFLEVQALKAQLSSTRQRLERCQKQLAKMRVLANKNARLLQNLDKLSCGQAILQLSCDRK
ncbi:hypothetical protein MRX96_031285 [Rhipicephalus microplus]